MVNTAIIFGLPAFPISFVLSVANAITTNKKLRRVIPSLAEIAMAGTKVGRGIGLAKRTFYDRPNTGYDSPYTGYHRFFFGANWLVINGV